jgi:hypothetical protein
MDDIFDDLFIFLIFLIQNLDRPWLLPMVFCKFVFVLICPWKKRVYGVLLYRRYLKWSILNGIWEYIIITLAGIIRTIRIHYMSINFLSIV